MPDPQRLSDERVAELADAIIPKGVPVVYDVNAQTIEMLCNERERLAREVRELREEKVEAEIGPCRTIEIEEMIDCFVAHLLGDDGRSIVRAAGETPSKALDALAALRVAPLEDSRPSLDGLKRKEMAPATAEERAKMIWAFREGCRRVRNVLGSVGFEITALCGFLGDEGMAQRCVPRVPSPPESP